VLARHLQEHHERAPVEVAGGLVFRSIATASDEVCGVTLTNRGYCWGSDVSGQIGDGEGSDLCQYACRKVPTPLAGDLDLSTISVGAEHACGVTLGGVGYCWGTGVYGVLGVPEELCNQDVARCAAPVAVSGGLTFSSIQAGNEHTCGLTTGEVLYCWGSNVQGQLGAAVGNSGTPVEVMGQR